MAGGERPHLNRNEAAEQEIKDAQKGEQHLAKLQDDGLFGQKGVERQKPGDALKEVEHYIAQTAERAMLALQKLKEAAASDPYLVQGLLDSHKNLDPKKYEVHPALLAGLQGAIGTPKENDSKAHHESPPLLTGLNRSEDPKEKQRQQDILAFIQNAFSDSTKT